MKTDKMKLKSLIQKEKDSYVRELINVNKQMYEMFLIDEEYIAYVKKLAILYFIKYANEICDDYVNDVYSKMDKMILRIQALSEVSEYSDYNRLLNNYKKAFNKLDKPFTNEYFSILGDICLLQAFKYAVESAAIPWNLSDSKKEIEHLIKELKKITYDDRFNDYQEAIYETEELIRHRERRAYAMYSTCSRTTLNRKEKKEIKAKVFNEYFSQRKRK